MADPLLKHSRVPRKVVEPTEKPPKERKPFGPKDGKLANAKGALAPLKTLQPADIIARYLADERSADIAASLGVTRSALNQWLLRTCQDQWLEAQIARALTRKEKAEDDLEDAKDPLALAKAREQLRSAQWELERILSRLYGQKQEMTVTVNTDLGERLRRARERAADAVTVEVVSQ